MRFRVWGISLFQLCGAALMPVLFWMVFRGYEQFDVPYGSLFRLYQTTLLWTIPVYFLFSLLWIYLVKHGIFRARFLFYTLWALDLGYELFSGVGDRSFGRIGIGLVMLAAMVGTYRWLESKIDSAQLNPRVQWFEGEPKTLPNLQARVLIAETWYEASVRLLDQKGLFLFLNQWGRDLKELHAKTPVSFELRFREKNVDGEGRLTSLFVGEMTNESVCQRPGIGLQFLPKDLYHFSQYTALVESLKGEGYV